MKRPTINDIADEVGVSKAAVSYALNGRPGVSQETRDRILEIAAEMGWRASSAAQAVSRDRAGAVGVVIARSPELLRTDPSSLQIVTGLEQTLSAHGISLQLALAGDTETELETYRLWWAERRVDGVLLTDLRVDDPRPTLLREMRVPAVFFGAERPIAGVPVLWADENDTADTAIRHLTELGHRRIGHVRGSAELRRTHRRDRELRRAAAASGAMLSHDTGDCSEDGGVAATARLLALHEPPTAIIYDNDVMAAASVSRAEELGVRIPHDLSVLAWDDSLLCRVVNPAVTAFSHDVVTAAATAGEMLLELIETGVADDASFPPRELISRASTAHARR